MYTYLSNSCYIDSLFMTIFKNGSNIWLNKILKNPIYIDDYTTLACGNNIKNKEQTYEYAQRLRNSLIIDYDMITTDTKILCSNIRNIIYECLTYLVCGNIWNLLPIVIIKKFYGII